MFGTMNPDRRTEGGEQGDPLMPALFLLGQHPALAQVHSQIREGEHIFAYLDDIYIVSHPDRSRAIFDLAGTALWEHARIRINLGKTRAWNAAGDEPPRMQELSADTDRLARDAARPGGARHPRRAHDFCPCSS
jgi:hypothetical protein